MAKTFLPPFSRIAYRNLGNDRLIVERLNREMEAHIRSKRGMDDLIDRIRKVTGMSYHQARTVARTERTRVQGQARYEAIRALNASMPGQRRYRKEWIARNDEKTRDSHAAMSGQIQYATRPFVTGAGNKLMFPGDPNAPASEVINCRCYIRRVSPVEDGKENVRP